MTENNPPPESPISRLPAHNLLPWEERYEAGRSLRKSVPRSAHAEWNPPPERDCISLLDASNEGRTKTLIPIRHGRMLASSFAYYRGAPAVMAYDLAHTPSSGVIVQLCGDCHVNNFGLFASPERALVFDLNDFDETLPGPFEWDIKRFAASIVVAARDVGLTERDAKSAVQMAARVYREKMDEFTSRSYLGIWYSRVDAEIFRELVKKKHRKEVSTALDKVRQKGHLKVFNKLTEIVDHRIRIIHDPPLIYRLDVKEEDVRNGVTELFTSYYESFDDSRKRLLSRYRFVDVAHKVVGVGSVGTRCFISLWTGIDEGDPLFIQVKQARPSILEPYLGRSEYDHPGRRVVIGQRLMQATNDIFLGHGQIGDDSYFVRQLYDMKGSIDLDDMPALYLERYAGLCGAVLARAHARTGDPAQIAGYLGKSDRFDQALVEFAFRYADQNESDWKAFKQAIRDGRLEAKFDEG